VCVCVCFFFFRGPFLLPALYIWFSVLVVATTLEEGVSAIARTLDEVRD